MLYIASGSSLDWAHGEVGVGFTTRCCLLNGVTAPDLAPTPTPAPAPAPTPILTPVHQHGAEGHRPPRLHPAPGPDHPHRGGDMVTDIFLATFH